MLATPTTVLHLLALGVVLLGLLRLRLLVLLLLRLPLQCALPLRQLDQLLDGWTPAAFLGPRPEGPLAGAEKAAAPF